jgi:hypothetical protein
MNARTELETYLAEFRLRLKRLVLARGGALLAVTALVITLAAVWIGTRRAFDAEFMLTARLILLAAIVAIAAALLWRPLRKLQQSRAVPDIEQRAPDFDGRIETYEGLVASGRKSPFLPLLAEDALRFARKVPAALGVSRIELSLPTAIAGISAVALLGLAMMRLFGEGDRQHARRGHRALLQQPRDARGEHARLAAARAGEDQRVAGIEGYGGELLRVEAFEVERQFS